MLGEFSSERGLLGGSQKPQGIAFLPLELELELELGFWGTPSWEAPLFLAVTPSSLQLSLLSSHPLPSCFPHFSSAQGQPIATGAENLPRPAAELGCHLLPNSSFPPRSFCKSPGAKVFGHERAS